MNSIVLSAAEQNIAKTTISQNANAIDVNLFDTRKDGRDQTIMADRIVYCSDFDKLNDGVIRDFAQSVFSTKDIPKVEHGNANLVVNPNEVTVYFFAGAKKISLQSEQCLETFTTIYPKVFENIETISKYLGEKPKYLKDKPYGKFLTPIFAVPAIFRNKKNIVVLYLSIAESPGRITQALSYLFGLKLHSCGENDACLALYNRLLKEI